jgi:hypothetical protein
MDNNSREKNDIVTIAARKMEKDDDRGGQGRRSLYTPGHGERTSSTREI